MTRTLVPLFALSMLAAGCGGGSYCKKNAKAAEDCGQEVTDADLEACEEMLEGCSRSDEKRLTAFTDCFLGDADVCGDGTETTDLDDLGNIFACFAKLEGISPECGAMGMGGTTTFTVSWTSTTDTGSR